MAWTVEQHMNRVKELKREGQGARAASEQAYREALQRQHETEQRD